MDRCTTQTLEVRVAVGSGGSHQGREPGAGKALSNVEEAVEDRVNLAGPVEQPGVQHAQVPPHLQHPSGRLPGHPEQLWVQQK